MGEHLHPEMGELKEKENWQERLKRFDQENGAEFLLLSSTNELIKRAVEGKNPKDIRETDQYLIEEYTGNYRTNFRGWPVEISSIEIGTRNPEYVAKRFGVDINEVRKTRYKKSENFYGGRVSLKLAEIDETRTLNIERERWPREILGERLKIIDRNRQEYPDIKYDIDLKKLNKEGGLIDEGLYEFADDLVSLSQTCKTGISAKILKRYHNKEEGWSRLGFSDLIHLYPRLEKDLKEWQTTERLLTILNFGKKLWGEAFDLNRSELGGEYTYLGYLHELKNLYNELEAKNGVKGSSKFYDSSELRQIIGQVLRGEVPLETITRTGGLRDKVKNLLEFKKKLKRDNK